MGEIDWSVESNERLNELIRNRRSLMASLEREIEEIAEELKKRATI